MTGYGKATIDRDELSVEVELSSLNSKHLNVNIDSELDPELREEINQRIQSRLERGKIDVTLRGDVIQENLTHSTVDQEAVDRYLEELSSLEERHSDRLRSVQPVKLLELPGVLTVETSTSVQPSARPLILDGLDQALDELVSMRQDEGRTIGQDLLDRAESIGQYLDQIEERVPAALQNHRERYRDRVEEVADLTPEEMQERVENEMEIYAEKCDIAEEVTRLHSHLEQIQEALESSGAVGKKLKFLFQELLREINTVGAKANDATISQLAVDVKSEIEKCREQVRNVE